MSYTQLHLKIKTARKLYHCTDSEWICNYGSLAELMDDFKMPFSDRRKLAILHNDRYKIYPGMKYYERVGVQDGYFFCIQSRIEAFDICSKYDLWRE